MCQGLGASHPDAGTPPGPTIQSHPGWTGTICARSHQARCRQVAPWLPAASHTSPTTSSPLIQPPEWDACEAQPSPAHSFCSLSLQFGLSSPRAGPWPLSSWHCRCSMPSLCAVLPHSDAAAHLFASHLLRCLGHPPLVFSCQVLPGCAHPAHRLSCADEPRCALPFMPAGTTHLVHAQQMQLCTSCPSRWGDAPFEHPQRRLVIHLSAAPSLFPWPWCQAAGALCQHLPGQPTTCFPCAPLPHGAVSPVEEVGGRCP